MAGQLLCAGRPVCDVRISAQELIRAKSYDLSGKKWRVCMHMYMHVSCMYCHVHECTMYETCMYMHTHQSWPVQCSTNTTEI